MQLYSVIEITNLEPLKIGAGGNKANQIEPSKDYIPGSTIRGAIIGQLIRRRLFDDCKNAILTQMECYNAYPCVDGNLYIPAPQHLRINKHEYRRAKTESRYDHSGNAGTIALTNLHDGSELSNHDALAFRFISVQNGELTGLNPVKEYRLHHNISRNKGEKARENLFRYQALAPGHTFRTIIRYDETLANVIEPVLQQPINLYLGGAKGSGYGLCRMQPLEIHVTGYQDATAQLGLHAPLNSASSSELTITCLSDCVFRNEYGQSVNYLPESEIHRITGVSVKLIKQYVQAGMTEGYNMTWKARYPKETTLKAGSVLVYQLYSELGSEELKQVKQALECKPVGCRVQDGYGWLAVNLPYPERMAVRSIQPISEYWEDNAKYAEPKRSINPQEEEVMSILLAELEPVKQRWLELLMCKLQEQGEQGDDRFVVSDQLNSSQLQQMKETLQPLIKQLKNGDLPSLPTDNTDRSYKKDNRLCSIAGHHFKELITFICSAASSSGSLSRFAQNKLNGKKGSLLFSRARYREQQFIAELLYIGLHVEQRRKDK
ncbi:RAMP superfamily CRISPR-associated protein [Paenibacillus alvei]|uniref:RAMP superfamily CRISPR-associated protein n=1 Tax=Paenibacillus alvei TaxID=44250 RepID=UPI003D2E3009